MEKKTIYKVYSKDTFGYTEENKFISEHNTKEDAIKSMRREFEANYKDIMSDADVTYEEVIISTLKDYCSVEDIMTHDREYKVYIEEVTLED